MKKYTIKWVLGLVITVAFSSGWAGAASADPREFQKDLGVIQTPWGMQQTFDRFRASKTAAPRYPTNERRAGIEGSLILAVLVSVEGKVKAVEVQRSSGNAHFDTAAVEAVKKWLYPKHTDGEFVSIQPVSFTISSR